MKKHLRSVLAVFIVAATIASFIYYVHRHPATITSLRQVPLPTLLGLLALYCIFFVAFVLMTRASLRLYRASMTPRENLLFNAYSSLINFFGPAQSGPIFRGAYLKKRHGLQVKQYVFATLLYYGFYAVISAFMMFVGTRPWWQTALLVVAAGVASLAVIGWYRRRTLADQRGSVHWPSVGWIFITTALQLGMQALIYMVELHSIHAHASAGQVLAYTGVANFALFVALTPGAIGIRESFLVFSERLHHISSNSIVAANILDRGAYLALLGVLAVLVVVLHARKQLDIGRLRKQ